ncbi:catalytic ligb subunit of aromatic ring-opening dioxygenase [Lucifera butyrica]|uniref:Catalytic ligb subunit of aromatic ring-opening dioxygenase n=1 Tax=Lucifera butyrica TaxID=1351585 RepID=A0A498RB22_9FIRM|nr:4,5-DOPA dioxygenase extradiol [Lucifera butyrica]VBB08150.1 catalytic ligb subunit of aromatic ring-opening dioxygenase [Lucifera butyrica]
MQLMPTLFIGHGSPMNIIEDNQFVHGWRQIVTSLPKPKAILAVSAHWYTEGTRVMDNKLPRTIHDFYGFPEQLYSINYPASGNPTLAKRILEILGNAAVLDGSWGLDHGTWCVLRAMYPNADIPVLQVSVNRRMSAEEHLALGKKLKDLRSQGVMIFGSGNVVHNLGMIQFSRNGGYDWAYEFDNYIAECVSNNDKKGVVGYKAFGQVAELAVPIPDHFYPLLYVLGAAEETDEIRVYNQDCIMGSLSMTSYVFA